MAITPKVGFTYKIKKDIGLFGNFSQGFLPPQVNELYQGIKIPDLKPAKFNSFELGGWSKINKKLSFNWSLYNMTGNNEILFVRLLDGTRENRNAGKTLHRGLEYSLYYIANSNITLRLVGSNSQHRFIDYIEDGNDYSMNSMGQSPFWNINFEFIYKPSFISNLRFSFDWQYLGKYFMDSANTVEYPGYNVLNTSLSYSMNQFEIWANIKNVFDVLYSTEARKSNWGDTYSLGELRTFNIGIVYNYQKNKN